MRGRETYPQIPEMASTSRLSNCVGGAMLYRVHVSPGFFYSSPSEEWIPILWMVARGTCLTDERKARVVRNTDGMRRLYVVTKGQVRDLVIDRV